MKIPSSPNPRVTSAAAPRSQPIYASPEDAMRDNQTYSEEIAGVTHTWMLELNKGSWGVRKQSPGGKLAVIASGLEEGDAIQAALIDMDKTRAAVSPRRSAPHSPPAAQRRSLEEHRRTYRDDLPELPAEAPSEAGDAEGHDEAPEGTESLLWRWGVLYPGSKTLLPRPAIATSVHDTDDGVRVTLSTLSVLNPDGQPNRGDASILGVSLTSVLVWNGQGARPRGNVWVPGETSGPAPAGFDSEVVDDLRAEFVEFQRGVGSALKAASTEISRLMDRVRTLEATRAPERGTIGPGQPEDSEPFLDPDPEDLGGEENANELTYEGDPPPPPEPDERPSTRPGRIVARTPAKPSRKGKKTGKR